jgi:hypothetical protein
VAAIKVLAIRPRVRRGARGRRAGDVSPLHWDLQASFTFFFFFRV